MMEPFLKGDPSVIYPFLAWMLERLPELKTRAYLARYLRPPSIPEEYFADDQIVSLMQKYSTAQEEFKQIHKSLEELRQTHKSPVALERAIKQGEDELEQLELRVQKLHKKVESSPEFATIDFDEMLQATHDLRKEQEEEASLARAVREQTYRLENAQLMRRQLNAKLKELQDSESSNTNLHLLLERLRSEVARQRHRCNEQLEREIRENDKSLREMERVLTSAPLSYEMVQQLQDECDALKRRINQLNQQRDALEGNYDDAPYRARAAAAESKRSALQDTVERLEEEKRELESELARVDTELQQLIAEGRKPITSKDIEAFAERLKDKIAEFKAVKATLKAVQTEVAVLAETEATLRERDSKLEEITAELERDRGIEGYSSVKTKLDDLTAQQADLNQAKATTLDEVSKLIDQIKAEITARRASLAPLAKKLKALRDEYEVVREAYERGYRQHESVAGVLRVEREELEAELEKLRNERLEDESLFHKLQMMMQIAQSRADMLHTEQLCQLGKARVSRECRSYQEAFERAIVEDAKEQRRLLEEQRALKATHQDDVSQRKLFTQLKSLVQAKIASLKKQQAREAEISAATSVVATK